MRKILGWAAIFSLLSVPVGSQSVEPPPTFAPAVTAPVTNNFVTGYPVLGGALSLAQPAFSNLSGSLGCSQAPALTGDVTSSAGSCATVLGNIPTGTTAAGTILRTNVVAPSTPASGKTQTYVDSTNKVLSSKNDAGTVSITVVPASGSTHQFATGLSVGGALSFAQPAAADLSDGTTGTGGAVVLATDPKIARIYGGTAAGSSITLQSTSNGAPSGDSASLIGSTINLKAASGATTVNVGNVGGGTGALVMAGGGGGSQTWQVTTGSVASGTISWPSGTRDFGITGGTHQVVQQSSLGGMFSVGQLAAGDISGLAASATTDTTNASNISSGTLPAGRLPNPSASTLGGIESITVVTHNFLTGISTAGVPSQAQPAAADITGLAASATTDTTNATNISSGTLNASRLPSGAIWLARQVFCQATGTFCTSTSCVASGAGCTYTPTAGATTDLIRCVGAGGGGGGAATTAGAQLAVGGAGGGGAASEVRVAAATVSGATVKIGLGGAGGTAGANAGTAGTNTTFGVLLTDNGGSGGAAGSAASAPASVSGANGGTTATGGDINSLGQNGSATINSSTALVLNAAAGDSGLGLGLGGAAIVTATAAAGTNGRGFGGGGTGAILAASQTQQAGGNGSDGLCIVDEFR